MSSGNAFPKERWRNQSERRFALSREQADETLALLAKHLPQTRYKDAPPITLVVTVYFDTPDGTYHQQALIDTQESVKVRAREYLPLSSDKDRKVLGHSDHCFLERKMRVGRIREKDRIQIPKTSLAQMITGKLPIPSEILHKEVSKHQLAPVLISMYERRVWQGDEDLRVTFDERIRYYRPQPEPYKDCAALSPETLGAPHAVGPKRILEVKHVISAPFPDWLNGVVGQEAEADSRVREARGFSKFLDGMARLGQSQRNRRLTRPISI